MYKERVTFVFVGPTGCGKSTLIKLLTQNPSVKTGNSPSGQTKDVNEYPVTIEGRKFKLYDTPGIGDLQVSLDSLLKRWNQELRGNSLVIVFCISCVNLRLNVMEIAFLKALRTVYKQDKDMKKSLVFCFTKFDRISEQEMSIQKFLYQVKQKLERHEIPFPNFRVKTCKNQPLQVINEFLELANNIKPQRAQSFNFQRIKKIFRQQFGCFSRHNLVFDQFGRARPITALRIGDTVQTWNCQKGKSQVEKVVTFMFKNSTHVLPYVSLELQNGKTITLTPQHRLSDFYGKMKMAEQFRRRDAILQHDGTVSFIKKIQFKLQIGFIAPLTNSGTIIVGGSVCSCFADIGHYTAVMLSFPLRKLKCLQEMQLDQYGTHPCLSLGRQIRKFFGK